MGSEMCIRDRREASAMLNRCERLRSLIEANDSLGRSVPQELPKTLTGAPSVGIQQNNNGRTLSMEMSGLPSVGLKVPDNEILFRGPDVGSHNAGRNGNRGHGSEVDVERCVVWWDAANFRARCGHGFCTKCRNQYVRGFGPCPVFTCHNVLSVETFERMG